jgi:hypothetical protein
MRIPVASLSFEPMVSTDTEIVCVTFPSDPRHLYNKIGMYALRQIRRPGVRPTERPGRIQNARKIVKPSLRKRPRSVFREL